MPFWGPPFWEVWGTVCISRVLKMASKFPEAALCGRSTRNPRFWLFRDCPKPTLPEIPNVFLTEGLHEMDVSGKRPRLAFIILKGTQDFPNRPDQAFCLPLRRHCTGAPLPNGGGGTSAAAFFKKRLNLNRSRHPLTKAACVQNGQTFITPQ